MVPPVDPPPQADSQAPRIGLLGPRRKRQGLGPFLASHVEHSGGVIQAFAASRWSSVEKAATELEGRLGHGVAGYVGLDAMLANEQLDGLVIASPVETHEPALLGALDAGVHVLCEKPFIMPGRGSVDRAQLILDSFHTQGLHVKVNVQWPYTLPSYFELFPEIKGAPVESFWMLLAPSQRGLGTLADVLDHPLSVLHALCPDPDPLLVQPEIEILTEDGSRIEVKFVYNAADRDIQCQVDLQHCADQPRPAGYGVNGKKARRRIDMADYGFHFDAEHGSVPVPDPTRQLVEDFLKCLRDGPPKEIDVSAANRLRMLGELLVG